ncbi:MAG: TolC family protein [Bacteroidales bacterium]|nr:TolC family protein [Bacteroidales bacterium]
MKSRRNLIISILFFVSINAYSQSFNEILETIEQNNKELQAGNKFLESKIYEHKQNNLPGGPSLSYGYFPDNSSVSGTKEVFEVSQSFQMPCFYRNQSAYSKLMIGTEELNHLVLRQNILSEAKSLLTEYVYLLKQISILSIRLKFAEDIYNAYLVRGELGDVNALEINKAKLHLLQVQKQEKDLQTQFLAITEKLMNLNGGDDLSLGVINYPLENLTDLDTLLFERLEYDPELLYNQKAFEASEKRIKVAKNLQLPEFSLGYGSETVANEKFKGFLVGVSVPLWGSKNSIQQAKAESDFYDVNNNFLREKRISETKIQFEKVHSLKENLESYETVLSSVNNEDLLNKSLELGEISVIEFFTEMFYFYEIYDDYLLLEKDYYQALTELYKYKL